MKARELNKLDKIIEKASRNEVLIVKYIEYMIKLVNLLFKWF
jgi:hypothetical protein